MSHPLEAHYLEAWQLSAPELMTETLTSRVLAVTAEAGPLRGQRMVLKLLFPAGDEERRGALALDYFDGDGAVRLLRHDEGAQLLELASGPHLSALVRAGRDDEATLAIAGVLGRLHRRRPSVPPDGLVPLHAWFRELFSRAHQATGEAATRFQRSAEVARRLLDAPREPCVLHGDVHHDNLREHPGRGYLAFDAKGLYGERTFDLANSFMNPFTESESFFTAARTGQVAEIFAGELGIPRERILAFVVAYGGLSASWSLAAGQPYEETLRIAGLADALLRAA